MARKKYSIMLTDLILKFLTTILKWVHSGTQQPW